MVTFTFVYLVNTFQIQLIKQEYMLLLGGTRTTQCFHWDYTYHVLGDLGSYTSKIQFQLHPQLQNFTSYIMPKNTICFEFLISVANKA